MVLPRPRTACCCPFLRRVPAEERCARSLAPVARTARGRRAEPRRTELCPTATPHDPEQPQGMWALGDLSHPDAAVRRAAQHCCRSAFPLCFGFGALRSIAGIPVPSSFCFGFFFSPFL